MTAIVYHLPALVLRDEGEVHQVMVTACGKRGPIRTREAGVGAQLELGAVLAAGRQCEECEVRWDAAEESGQLLVRWVVTGLRDWKAAGAVLWKHRPVPYRCRKCGRDEESLFKPDCLAVVLREDRSKVRKVGT